MRNKGRTALALLAAVALMPMTATAAGWEEVRQKLQTGASFTTADGQTSVTKQADGSYVISGGIFPEIVSLNENSAPSDGTLELHIQNVTFQQSLSLDANTAGRGLDVTLDANTSTRKLSVSAANGGHISVTNAGRVTGQAPNEGLISNIMGEGSYGEVTNAQGGVISGQMVSYAGNGANQKVVNDGIVMRDMRTGSCYYGTGGQKDFSDMDSKAGGSTETINNGTVNGWLSIQAGGKGNVGTLTNNGMADEMVDNNAEMWGKLTVVNNGTVRGHFGGWGAGGPAELHVTNSKGAVTGKISVDSYDGGVCSVTNDGRVNEGIGVYIEAEMEPATLTVTNNAEVNGNIRVGLGKNSVGEVYNRKNGVVRGNLYVWSNGKNAKLVSINEGRYIPFKYGWAGLKMPDIEMTAAALAEEDEADKTEPGEPGGGLLIADDTLGGSVRIENYGQAEGVKLSNTAIFAQMGGTFGAIESTEGAYKTPGEEKPGDAILAEIETSSNPTNEEMLAQLGALGISAQAGEHQVLIKTKGADGAAEYRLMKVQIPEGGLKPGATLDTSNLPKTGDAARPRLWGAALLACAGAFAYMKRKKA